MDANQNLTAEMIKIDPYNYTLSEMVDVIGETEAKKLFKSIYKGTSKLSYQTIKVKDVFNGGDTRKYAFELCDHYCIETVCIQRKTGTTVCVSIMVGCPVGCVFCESGKNGFIRNLTPSEIVQQIVLLREKVNRIVFMGMGEPLFNYDNLVKAIHILRDRDGLNFPTDGITISTVGPLQQLKKIREEHLKIQLTLSLHATDQRTRDIVMPHMKGHDIRKVVETVLSYSERHNRKVTIAYLLIPGLNDRSSDVRQLGKWFRGKNVLINLLQYNETSNSRIKRPNKQQLVAFKTRLEDAGLEVKIRESRGNRIKAACGQLVSEYNRQGKKTANRTVNGTENSNGSVRKSSFTGRASSKRHPFAKHKNVGKKRKHE